LMLEWFERVGCARGCGRGVEGHGRESVKTQVARQDCAASGL